MRKKIVITLIALSVILTALFVIYSYNIRTRNAVEKLIESKKMINLLIAGSNAYNKNRHRFFVIVSINPENNNIGMTFIPPSYSIEPNRSGSKPVRIDSVDFSDFNLIRRSILRDLKISIPFYVELYSPDVKRITDLIEGVDIFVLDQAANIPGIKFGLNYFDGDKIVKYINSASENSIYIKFDRIQDIIFTIYNTKERLKKFLNIRFIAEVLRSIKTNLLPQEVLKIGEIIYNKGDLITTILPGNLKNDLYFTDDISYKIYEDDFLTPLIMGKGRSAVNKIKVLNGTEIPGLARKMRNRLIREGFNVVEFGTSPYKKLNKSIIISRKGDLFGLGKLSEFTGISKVYPVIDNTLLYNVLIIIGKDMVQ